MIKFREKSQDIPPSLVVWTDKIIQRYYPGFDEGHGPEHARTVISRGLRLGDEYTRLTGRSLSRPLILAACALHDIGLSKGRENHEIESGRLVRKDPIRRELGAWFEEREIETIAQAVEDHRASLQGNPRSVYGCIVSQSDRTLEVSSLEELLERSVKYNLKAHPELGPSQLADLVSGYMIKKYSPGGEGSRIILDVPSVREETKKVQSMLHDKKRVREVALKLIEGIHFGRKQ